MSVDHTQTFLAMTKTALVMRQITPKKKSLGKSDSQSAYSPALKTSLKTPTKGVTVKDPFTNQARHISKSITKFQKAVTENYRVHVNYSRSLRGQSREGEKEQMRLENEAQSLANMCNAALAALSKEVDINTFSASEQVLLHQKTAVLLLEEYLQRAIKSFEDLKTQRILAIKQIRESFQPKKLSFQNNTSIFGEENPPERKEEASHYQFNLSADDQLVLEQENKQLHNHLLDSKDAVASIIKTLHHLSHIQNNLSNHIHEQAQELERIDQTAVETTENVILGNEQLKQAIESGLDFRIYTLMYLVMCSFCLWFLDWYG